MREDDPPDGGGGGKLPPDIDMPSSSSRLKRPASPDLPIPEVKKTKSPAISNQSVYVCPGFESDENFKYGESDKGPFTVQVSRVEPDPSAGFSIRVLKFAQLLHKNKVQGISQGGIQASGRNKVGVTFSSAQHANDFVSNPLLSQNKLSAIIPRYQVSRLGVIRDIPTDCSLEELMLGLKSPENCGQVVKARRLNMKRKKDDGSVTWVPSNTVVLTFTGQILPEKVFCYKTSFPVSLYQLPTIQCRKCCRFGHIQAQCRSKPRCFKCAQQHTGDTCGISENQISCFLCRGGNHSATDPRCPEHYRQKSIKLVMSEENLSYTEAALRFPTSRVSYADVVTQNYPSQSHNAPSQNMMEPALSPDLFPSLTPTKTSYRKTVSRSPRPAPTLGKSYDVQAHNLITQSPRSSQPNGCALNSDPTPMLTPNDNLIELLICSLINIISKFSDSIPSNVSALLQQLLNTLINKNGSQAPSMEL